jgi:hypothetical protein
VEAELAALPELAVGALLDGEVGGVAETVFEAESAELPHPQRASARDRTTIHVPSARQVRGVDGISIGREFSKLTGFHQRFSNEKSSHTGCRCLKILLFPLSN